MSVVTFNDECSRCRLSQVIRHGVRERLPVEDADDVVVDGFCGSVVRVPAAPGSQQIRGETS
jgi:hypothetical protein